MTLIRSGKNHATPLGGPPLSPDRLVTIWGQSNAVGYGANSASISGAYATEVASYRGSLARVFVFNVSTAVFENFDLDATNNAGGEGTGGTTFGPEFSYAVRWMQNTITGNLYIQKHAQGGVDINFFQPGFTFFSNDLGYHTQAVSWLASHGAAPVDAGWHFVQGEADAAAGATQLYYHDKLVSLIAGRVSNALQDSTTSRNVLSRQGPSSTQYSAAVNAAMTQYASEHTGTTRCIDYVDSYVDGVHLGANAMLQLGYDAYAQMPLMP